MKNILIIQLNRLGDIVITLPLIMTLNERFRDCRITLVCYKQFSAIIRDSPAARWVHRFVQADAQNPDALFSFDKVADPGDSPFPELFEEYDMAINLVYGDHPAAFFSKIKAQTKFGQLATAQKEIRLAGDWPRYLFSFIPYREYNLFNMTDLFTRYSGSDNKKFTGYLDFDPQLKERAHEILKENGFNGGIPVALQLGASEAIRRWDTDKFAKLGHLLKEKNNEIEIVLIGSPDEAALAAQFREMVRYPVIDLVGKTGLLELPAVLSRCKLLVSNDTGPIHVASAVGVKTLGIYFLAAYYAETGPYGEGNIVVQAEPGCHPCTDYYQCGHKKCRPMIPAEAVTMAAAALLDDCYDSEISWPDVSVYRSRFMPNGSLIYLPVLDPANKPLSPKFEKGLIYRIMWEKQEDVPAYVEMIGEELPGFWDSDNVKSILAAFTAELRNMKEIFTFGAAACRELVNQFSKPGGPDKGAINKPLKTLKIIESFIDKREEPLSPLKLYSSFEMMDVGYLQFPALGEELKKKYLKLCDMADGFLLNLEAISASGV